MQIGFYFDQTRCTGCSACRVACKDWHDIPAGPENWMRIVYTEKGRFPDPSVSYMIAPCWHCLSPVCVPACPSGAIKKREEDGIVLVDNEACLGNDVCDEKCLKACPYDAPQFGPEKGARMRKCTFCLDRFSQGNLPNCIEACPVRALDAGPLEELEGKYGNIKETEGFRFSRSRPAVVIKPKA
ncbi:MAG: 4Fe-4S dicluster domain-containing protein [Pseudomonadota bacterium]|nr:4Fe-4S dicluster domain-containing protein [Desulfobacterales bacterium]MBL7101805.1 4Fe-4S dicluster domain-containing protein [Desulfobacteraceae bacterium]MBU0989024.1 4Fe-4S dicluster domain-containing protein [Pseudomonadota bacterium]